MHTHTHTHTCTHMHTHTHAHICTHTHMHSAGRIGIISTNFTIGFGSFVDKQLAPYVNVNPARLMNPCIGSPEVPQGCQPPYSYRHVVSLTTNQTLFNVTCVHVAK